jgi:hypothetical protein
VEILIEGFSPTGAFQKVLTVHDGKSLSWNTQTHSKLKFHNAAQIFKEVNELWAAKSAKEQQEIFDAYEAIHISLSTPDDGERQSDKLKLLVAKIYKHFTVKNAEEIVNGLNLVYPSTMAEEFGAEGDNGRTHRRSDYHRLVQLAIRLRPMLPIFGQYIRTFLDQPGSQYRESTAVEILNGTDVLTMPAVEKLISFMEVTLKNFQHQNSAILGGKLGTAEMPYWLVAKAIFRRVAPGEIHSADDVSSIITNVYNFVVKSTLDSVPRNFGGAKPKTRTAEGAGKSDENISLLESIRIREQVSGGKKVFVNVFSRNILFTARRVDPTVPEDLVNECCRPAVDRLTRVVHPVQETLTRWVLSRGCPPSHYDLLKREGAHRYVGATQALLQHWGYLELAALMEAVPPQDMTLAPSASLWHRDTLSKDRLEALRVRYPYTITLTRRDQNPDEANIGFSGITELARQIHSEEWVLAKDSRYYSRVQHNEQGHIILPPGFRNILCDLLLEVSSGTW